ncbi:unnamed protein product, partial [Pocillopora meandrina]
TRSHAVPFSLRGVKRLATEYKKVLYREFTDETFSQEKAHPPHLGFLGPVIKGEVGDTIRVHFKNMARRPFTVHPHGLFYSKAAEGSLYADHSSADQKRDDMVGPNEENTYNWFINEHHAPTESDEDCVTRMYHSHVISPKDTNTGLIGPLLICKRGALMADSVQRKNVDHEFVLLFTEMNENESWLLDDNIDSFLPDPAARKALKADPEFQASNKMASINGFIYGNLPGLDMCQGDKVSWHMIGLGTWSDVHNPSFHGHTVMISSHRTDTATLLPSTFITAFMRALNPGTWLLNCMNSKFFDNGMAALFNVQNCSKRMDLPNVSGGKTRIYYIAAEDQLWDYGPTGQNNIDGMPLTSPKSESFQYFTRSGNRIGGQYKKAVYVEYTDDTFTSTKNRSADEEHLGFLGPVIRAEVGDEVKVVFKNKASRNYTIHPQGVFYDKANEGSQYQDGTTGNETADNAIAPNGTYSYRWIVPDSVAPAENDPACLTWMYYSNVDSTRDIHSGLIGPLLICKNGTLDRNGKQRNINREFFLRFALTDEGQSWYLTDNKYLANNGSAIDENDSSFKKSNQMRNINGYMFGNLPGLRMCKGDNISWHFMGGPASQMHAVYFYGNTFTRNGNSHDTLGIMEGSLESVRMTPGNPGVWKLICRANNNLRGGMVAKYTVSEDCGKTSAAKAMNGRKRVYHIAAVEETWDYAPSGKDLIEGVDLKDSEFAPRYTIPGPHFIGRKYKKAIYREFTDATFTKQKPRKKEEEHLGIMGPMIKAEVGDTIEVVFKNLATRPYSVHPHGILYSKQDEGSSYKDNTTGTDTADNAIAPGKLYNYIWKVSERSGPGPADTACLTWAYFSDVDPVKDTNTGLVGPLIICRKGILDRDGQRIDVDREFSLMFVTMDENNNWYIDENIKYLTEDPGPLNELKAIFNFWESNLKAAINGYVFGNMPPPTMYTGEKVVWYLLQVGGMTEMHTVHFHGQSILYKSLSYHRGDVYDLLPETFASVEMIPDAVGTWMVHCHVNVHITGGMQALFTVLEPTSE